LRDVEDLLAERGIAVSYESIQQRCNRFGPVYAQKLKKRQGRLGDAWYLDEVFNKIRGELLNANDRRVGSNRQDRLSTFLQCMAW